MTDSYFDSIVPDPGEATEEELGLRAAAETAAKDLDSRVRTLELGERLEAVFQLVRATNDYMDRNTPWKLAKDPGQRERLGTVLQSACEAIRQISILISPAMPGASRRIREQLGIDAVDERSLDQAIVPGDSLVGVKINRGPSIFPRVETEA